MILNTPAQSQAAAFDICTHVRGFELAATPLGPAESWPESMRFAMQLLLRMPMPMISVWGKDQILLYNEATATLLHERHRTVFGRRLTEAFPEFSGLTHDTVQRALRGESFTLHDQYLDLDRGAGPLPAWFDFHVTAVNAPDGTPLGIMAVLMETTAKQQLIQREREIQAALTETEARYRTLTDLLPQLVWSCQPDGLCNYLSRQWVEYTGIPEAEQMGLAWIELSLHPDDRKRVYEHWMGAVEDAHGYDIEYRIRRRDGVYRWFKVRGTAVRNHSGAIIYWIGTCTDIEDIARSRELQAKLRERAEEQVRDRTRERDRIWNVSQDLLMLADREWMPLALSPAWVEVLGYTEQELMQGRTNWLVHPDDLEITLTESRAVAAGERRAGFRNRVRCRDGSYRWISWTAVAEDEYIYATGRDVTTETLAAIELESAQEQLRQSQKMEAIGQLTGGIAHDLNNMLQGILGPLELLRRRNDSGRLNEAERQINSAIGAANRAASLTHRLLAFARRQSLESRPVDVNALIGTLHELLHRTLGTPIQIELDLDPTLWPALCDANQLESALLNLSVNARDAMPSGGRMNLLTRRCSIATDHSDRKLELSPGDYVLIEVADNGVGMSPETAAKAFDPFFTTKPIGQGTGLGLSMIYGFVRQSGGAVTLDTLAGRGTRVRLYLPRAEADVATDTPARTSADAVQPALSTSRSILVVEDDATVRGLLAQLLEDEGCAVLQAADGQAALPILASACSVDLLITDVGLPGMNGRQIAEVARMHRPKLPILFVTGYAEHALARSGFLGLDMHMINKPFTIDAFLKRIREILPPA